MQPYRSILIVGGGTAGWLAACYLQRVLGSDPQAGVVITLVESPEIGTIGVGEATVPTLRTMMAALGIAEGELFAQADASLKNGIRFVGWRCGGDAQTDRYDHPFDQPAVHEGFNLAQHWLNLKQRGLPVAPLADATVVQTALFDANASPKLMHSADYQAPVPYAYHLDAVKLAALLRRTATGRGVQHLQGRVREVQRRGDGADREVQAVVLDDGRRLEADLFVDCSGFGSLLLGDALAVPWVSYTDALCCDRAIACPIAHGDAPDGGAAVLRSYTVSTAREAGWTWEIDLPSRRGTGYVYSARHCSDDEALATLQRLHGPARRLAEPRVLPMRVGRHARQWQGNVLALGLAGGFIEPLESTAIYLIEHALQAFVDHLPAHAGDGRCRDRFNALMADLYDELRDFIVLHYTLSDRRDTPFWREATDPARVPPSLAEALALWDAKLPSPTDLQRRLSLFAPGSWLFVMAGMRRLPSRGAGPASFIPPALSQQALQSMQRIRAAAVQQSPAMRDLAQKLRAAHGNRPAAVQADGLAA